jgi:nitrous oxidase accessory protein NosD
MKKALFVLLVSLIVSLSVPRPASADVANNGKANIIVDDDKVQCPTAQYTTIQAAVNAANPGDVIRVCAGTYPEQVTISTPLTLRADNGVIVIPSGVTQNSTGSTGSDSIAAVFLVNGVQDVDIEGFIVDGSNSGLAACSPRLIGIFYLNASGHVRHNAVRHMTLGSNPNVNGCQSGNGVEVETGSGSSSNVGVSENSVWDYQKNGITGNEQGTQLVADGNAVTGIGPTTGAAQNGIQIGFGAGGKVTNNTVTDNVWATCTSPTACTTNAAGILIFESNGVFVANNSLATNQVGIYIGGQNSAVVSNTISNSVTLIGIAIVGDDNFAARNTLSHADQAGFYIQGNNNGVIGNQITDASVGVLKISGSTGNKIIGNTYFANLVTVQDPAAARVIGVVPVR